MEIRRRLRRMRLLVLVGAAGILVTVLLVREKPTAKYAAAVAAVITMCCAAIIQGVKSIAAREYSQSLRVLTPLRRERKRARDDARFFRSPPLWQDFEEQYVVPRTEMRELVTELRRMSKGVLLVQGDPACGKTVLARHTEYTLLAAKFGFRRPLYRIEAKRLAAGDYQTLNSELDDTPNHAVVIIDDVHLHFDEFAGVAERFANRKIVFLYISRPLSNLPVSLTARFRDLVSREWQLNSGTIARKIVGAYLSREMRMTADAIASNDAIFAPYYTDLWVLAAALQTYKDYGHTAAAFRAEIARWVCENVLTRSTSVEASAQAKRAGALAVAAALYQFEIPVDRRLLLTLGEIDDDDVAALLRAFDLQEHTGSAFALYHSSYAKLILSALASPAGMGLVPAGCFEAATALAIDPIQWPEAVVTKHLDEVRGRTIMDLATLSAATAERRELVVNCFRRVSDAAVNAALDFRLTPSVQAVGALLQLFLIAGRALQPETKRRLGEYAATAEGATPAWAWATENAARLDHDLAVPFVKQLAQRLATETARVVARVATTLSYTDMRIAEKALADLDPQSLARRTADESTALLDFAVVVAKVVWVRPDWITAFVDLFDGKSKTATTVDFGHAISRIAWGSATAAEQLVRALPRMRITEIISRGNSDQERAEALGILATVSRDTAVDICGGIVVPQTDVLLATMIADLRHGPEKAWAAAP